MSRNAGRATAVASVAIWGYHEVVICHVYSATWIGVWNGAARLALFLIINELAAMLQLAHGHESGLARTDRLTGIANARVFEEHVNRAIAQSRRDGHPFTLTAVDLDCFKQVNDEHGHAEGDRLLREVARIVERNLRVTDIAARLGGDEFGILMPSTGSEQARSSLERVAASLADEVGERWGVAATFGAVTFAEPPDDVDCAVRQADDLMYRGKAMGGGHILQATWPEPGADCD